MFTDDDLIQLSALQHFAFCKRQCALIHIEQQWNENLFTAEGRIMHDKVHEERIESRKGVRVERGISIKSRELGLTGKTDVVEFHRDKDGTWQPFPVEYKRGKPKANNCDNVQLCAQALCLEEMLDMKISAGAIFYGKTRRRTEVVFDDDLRQETKSALASLHEFFAKGKTPLPIYDEKCDACSFFEVCLPKVIEEENSVENYLHEAVS